VHGEDQNSRIRICPSDFARRFQPAHNGHGYIHDNYVRLQLLAQANRFTTITGLTAHLPIVLRFKDLANTVPDNLMVINYQDC